MSRSSSQASYSSLKPDRSSGIREIGFPFVVVLRVVGLVLALFVLLRVCVVLVCLSFFVVCAWWFR